MYIFQISNEMSACVKKIFDSWINLIVGLSAHHRKGTSEIYNYMYTVYYSLRVYKLGFKSVTFLQADPDILSTDPPESIKIQNFKEENLSTLHCI